MVTINKQVNKQQNRPVTVSMHHGLRHPQRRKLAQRTYDVHLGILAETPI